MRWRHLAALACLAGCATHQAKLPPPPPPAIHVWNSAIAPVNVELYNAAGQQCAQARIAREAMVTLLLCGVADSLAIETPTEIKSYRVLAGGVYVTTLQDTFWFLRDATGRRL